MVNIYMLAGYDAKLWFYSIYSKLNFEPLNKYVSQSTYENIQKLYNNSSTEFINDYKKQIYHLNTVLAFYTTNTIENNNIIINPDISPSTFSDIRYHFFRTLSLASGLITTNYKDTFVNTITNYGNKNIILDYEAINQTSVSKAYIETSNYNTNSPSCINLLSASNFQFFKFYKTDKTDKTDKKILYFVKLLNNAYDTNITNRNATSISTSIYNFTYDNTLSKTTLENIYKYELYQTFFNFYTKNLKKSYTENLSVEKIYSLYYINNTKTISNISSNPTFEINTALYKTYLLYHSIEQFYNFYFNKINGLIFQTSGLTNIITPSSTSENITYPLNTTYISNYNTETAIINTGNSTYNTAIRYSIGYYFKTNKNLYLNIPYIYYDDISNEGFENDFFHYSFLQSKKLNNKSGKYISIFRNNTTLQYNSELSTIMTDDDQTYIKKQYYIFNGNIPESNEFTYNNYFYIDSLFTLEDNDLLVSAGLSGTISCSINSEISTILINYNTTKQQICKSLKNILLEKSGNIILAYSTHKFCYYTDTAILDTDFKYTQPIYQNYNILFYKKTTIKFANDSQKESFYNNYNNFYKFVINKIKNVYSLLSAMTTQCGLVSYNGLLETIDFLKGTTQSVTISTNTQAIDDLNNGSFNDTKFKNDIPYYYTLSPIITYDINGVVLPDAYKSNVTSLYLQDNIK